MSEANKEETVIEAEPQSIWFFVGMLLSIYGVIILLTGLFGKAPETVLGESRPAIWWGAIMMVFGIVFVRLGWKSGTDRAGGAGS